jgi:aminopeptidase-like protein
LHTLPAQPTAIPYLTSYYKRDWGFCLSNEALQGLQDGDYEVCIDSDLEPGSLTLAECVLPGESEQEVLLSSYCCHPSLANNELSGPIALASIYRHLAALEKRRYTYRFFLGGETIGSLAYLHLRGELLTARVIAGLVITCCGDAGKFTYKKVRRADNILDRAVMHALSHSGADCNAVEFFPTGSDERQYCSPGFNLPVGSLMRTMYGMYAEYHTSLDDLSLVSAANLAETVQAYLNCIYTLEHNRSYINLKPFGEPMLSKYGLYQTLGGQKAAAEWTRQLRYCLNFSDGNHGHFCSVYARGDARVHRAIQGAF